MIGTIMRSPAKQPRHRQAGETVLTVTDVAVELDEKVILDGVSLELKAGEVLALVGPNGAGKSTLFNAITSDVDLSAGKIELDGAPSTAWTNAELAMRRAVMLQQVDIAFPFTVAEVVEMGRSPWRGTDSSEHDDTIVAGAMQRADVSQFADRRYTSLSGGERARAALARVLAQTATVMLLDEPTAPLDIKHQENVLQLVREYAATGCAIVIIVHNLDLAAAYADRIALLANGKIVAQGTPQEVLTAERVSAVYDYPVQVVADPHTGLPVIVPLRQLRHAPGGSVAEHAASAIPAPAAEYVQTTVLPTEPAIENER